MSFLSYIICFVDTLYDHKTNDCIRHELRITGILDKIDEYRWNWLSHLQRMPQNRIPLKSYHYRPQGRRAVGRPNKRWREQLELWRWNGSKGPILDVYDDDLIVSTLDKLHFVFCTEGHGWQRLLWAAASCHVLAMS